MTQKYALHLHAYGKDWYVMKPSAKLANREIRYSVTGRKVGVRFTNDKRLAMKFSSAAAATARWSRLVTVLKIRGWVVSAVPHPVKVRA